METTSNGIMFSEDIISINGAAFMLYPAANHTKADIDKAKRELRDQRDVVRLEIANEEDRDELYRAEIFQVPETKSLKWYEINAEDRKLLRKERKAGLTPTQYVQKYVLPFVEQTRNANFKHFGKDKCISF